MARATQAASAQGATEAIGVLDARVVLAVTFGSVLAAGLPLLTALFGVGLGVAGILALSSVVDLTSTTPVLGVMIGLAVGIDYTLFSTIRHKQQLADGMDPRGGLRDRPPARRSAAGGRNDDPGQRRGVAEERGVT